MSLERRRRNIVVDDNVKVQKVKCRSDRSKDKPNVLTQAGLPSYWPAHVTFLGQHSIPSAKLPERLHVELCTEPESTAAANPDRIRSKGWTVVKPIDERSAFLPAYGSSLAHHPAVGQCGLFAQRNIPPRTLVVPYLGLAHLAGDENGDEDPESQYDAAIQASDGTRLGIDATSMGSEARFVNDYRGILVRPNLFFDEWSERTQSGIIKGLALYTGAHEVSAGTELCVSYGKGWWAARSKQRLADSIV